MINKPKPVFQKPPLQQTRQKVTGRLLAFAAVFFLLLAVFNPSAAQSASSGLTDAAELEAFIDGVMASQMKANHVPGAVVVVVKDGEVFFSKGYGYADLEAQIPVDPETTLFRPGSVSKLFIWTAVMQLYEQGRLSLDADVNSYLDFEIPATFEEPITLRHLLTHTPGFEDKGEGLFRLKPEQVISLESYVKQNIPARIFPPGEIGAYSNYGSTLAGYIIERISGMPFYEYVEQNILAPLGMTQSTFRQPLPDPLASQLAQGYNFTNGSYIQGGFEYVVGYPAGSLSATGLDMARFMIAHLQNGRYGEARILDEKTAIQMHSPLFSHDPRLSGMAYGFFEGTINGQRAISHGGDTMLFHSQLYLLLEQNIGLYVSTNGTRGSLTAEAVVVSFMDRYFPVDDLPALSATADFLSRAPLYQGEYYLSRGNHTTLEKILRLATPINVRMNEQNQVVVSIMGQLDTYVEVEPGLLVNRDNRGSRLVMKEVEGQVYIFPASPFVFIKTPWHGSIGLHLLVLVGGTLLFLGTIAGWGFSGAGRLMRREIQPVAPRFGRWAAVSFGLIYVIFLGTFAALFTNNDPAYGVPYIFFEVPAWVDNLMILPVLLVGLAISMAAFTVLAWARRFWNFGARLLYTFLTFMALAIIWSLWYWNLLL